VKTICIIIAVLLLAGCASGIKSISKELGKSEKALGQRIDVVWKQKDCRAGIAQALIETRPRSLQAETSVKSMLTVADPMSEEYRKCYFFAVNYSWELYALQDLKEDIIPGILDLIGVGP